MKAKHRGGLIVQQVEQFNQRVTGSMLNPGKLHVEVSLDKTMIPHSSADTGAASVKTTIIILLLFTMS